MARTFKDLNGKIWGPILFTGPLFEQIENKLGIDISAEDGSGLLKSAAKGWNVVRICFICCERQIMEAYSCSAEEAATKFGEAMASGEVIQEATEALREALVFFTRPRMKAALTQVFRSQDEVTEAAVEETLAQYDGATVKAAVKDAVKAGMMDAMAKISTTIRQSGSSANVSPVTSESETT